MDVKYCNHFPNISPILGLKLHRFEADVFERQSHSVSSVGSRNSLAAKRLRYKYFAGTPFAPRSSPTVSFLSPASLRVPMSEAIINSILGSSFCLVSGVGLMTSIKLMLKPFDSCLSLLLRSLLFYVGLPILQLWYVASRDYRTVVGLLARGLFLVFFFAVDRSDGFSLSTLLSEPCAVFFLVTLRITSAWVLRVIFPAVSTWHLGVVFPDSSCLAGYLFWWWIDFGSRLPGDLGCPSSGQDTSVF